jgi:predicted membrane protein
MFDHKTRRVLISFRIVFLTFDLCFRSYCGDYSCYCFIIIKGVLFLLVVLLTLFQVTGDNPEKDIVKVVEGHRLDET